MSQQAKPTAVRPLKDAVSLHANRILNGENLGILNGISDDAPVLVVLAAGRGTRFGPTPKCIQPVCGSPLARHSIDAFRHFSHSPVICVVGYREAEVTAALGADNIYVRSENPVGGTAFAAFEALSVPGLLENNPLLVITMGDRVVPSSIFAQLCEMHRQGEHEADLTFLTAEYEPPRNRGKGRILRDKAGNVLRIVEETDIANRDNAEEREFLLNLTEGNCPVYVIRAATLQRYIRDLTNANGQMQYYITDAVNAISESGGEIRTVTTTISDLEYDVLCAELTYPMDLALLEGTLAKTGGMLSPAEQEIERAARVIIADRPAAQVASIARQFQELISAITGEKLAFEPDRPLAIGISGGRLRIAFMHPDMARFYGPAWQMPIGAGHATGGEQITMLVQSANDRRIHLFPTDAKYREKINSIASDNEVMYPGESISDSHAYEQFGTHMSETVLLSLGYFSDEELEQRLRNGLPLPPAPLWISNSMRRPFALVDSAIASMRTLGGNLGARAKKYLSRENFTGLRLVCTGNIPEGGFSSSSAVTVATENALNALWEIGIPPDMLVQLACQAEYATGVRAGALDQATEQKGSTGQGTLISSNPRENYRIIGTYPVPTDRFRILFPFSVERDRVAWRWSCGRYGEFVGSGPLTTGETRKLTGKAAEIAALLTRLPLDQDFFQVIEDDLTSDGVLSRESREWICSILRQVPLLSKKADLYERVLQNRDWYVGQLMAIQIDATAAAATATLASLFEGWRDPLLQRRSSSGTIVEEEGVPLRAMLAYLFSEVAKNFYLIHHPGQWIEYVTQSQRGDRCFDIDPDRLPARDALEKQLDWERSAAGPDLLMRWLDRHGATPFDYNEGIDDESLGADNLPEFHRLSGSNFFRGLALIDLAEAMLKRAFGEHAVAVRLNAAGQGDYFQVHVDKLNADPAEVKNFLRAAFYRRFGLSPDPEFVEVHPGGGALGIRLSRYDALARLITRLEAHSRDIS